MDNYQIILPKGREKIIESILKDVSEGGSKVFVVTGESGSGKSAFLELLGRRLEKEGKKVLRVSASLGGILNAVKNIEKFDVFILDDVDIILDSGIPMDDLMFVEFLDRVRKMGKVVVISCERWNVDRLKKISKVDRVVELTRLGFEDFKRVLESMWGDSFKKFSEEDLKKIYENSGGNLKLAYIISSIIYREKKRSTS